MDKYSGKVAFWERYEILNYKDKITFLTPLATKIMKNIVVSAKSPDAWARKRDMLILDLIQGYDILIEVKNQQQK